MRNNFYETRYNAGNTPPVYEIFSISNSTFLITWFHAYMFVLFPFISFLCICKNVVGIYMKKKNKSLKEGLSEIILNETGYLFRLEENPIDSNKLYQIQFQKK